MYQNLVQQKHIKERIIFYVLWIATMLLQAYYTELLADEAYYWKYAQNLDWGYFDHPPMVAVFIKAGYALFQNELGVRLLFVISSSLFIYLLELLTRPAKPTLFYLAIICIGSFHFLGFFALPDMPLLFFTALFFYFYRLYLTGNKLIHALLLAITIALLLYSKYHGILIVFFTLIAYPTIMKRGSFWIIALVSVILFLPHVFWQINNGFPSLKFHLSERSGESYNIEFTLMYLLSVLLMFGPSVGVALGWKAIRIKPENLFNRVLYANAIGILVFFFLMTFKGRTEGNWVAIALVPAFITGYKYSEREAWFKKAVVVSAAISLPLIFIIRLYAARDFLPVMPDGTRHRIHNTKEWANAIWQVAGETPVAFMNSYQNAAWYEFYTGQPAISLNNRMGRRNQYDFWPDEGELQGKRIMLVSNYETNFLDTFNTVKGIEEYMFIDNFRTASSIAITPQVEDISTVVSSSFEMPVSISYNAYKPLLNDNNNYPPVLQAMYFKDGKLVEAKKLDFDINNETFHYDTTIIVEVPAIDIKGEYKMYLDIQMGWLPHSINMTKPVYVSLH